MKSMAAKKAPAVVFSAGEHKQSANLRIGSQPEPDDGLIPTPEEVRNGWSATTLRTFLMASCPTPFQYTQELVLRACDRQRIAAEAVAAFKRDADVEGDTDAKAHLRVLEHELAHATAAVAKASERAVVAEAQTR